MPLASATASGGHAVRRREPAAAGAAHARLDLVEHQQRAVLPGELRARCRNPVGEVEHAGLALDRLDEQRGDVIVEGVLEGRDVTEGQMHHVRGGRPERLPCRGPPCT